MNDVDWESLEKTWGSLLKNTLYSRLDRNFVKVYRSPEELVILIYAYEKFERMIQK